jgi:pilus assembly protein CpaE
VGKTVVAVNLAIAMGRRRRVVLVDCSLQFGDVAALLNLTPDRSLADLAAGDAVSDSEVVEQFLVAGPGGIQVLAAPPSPELADYMTPQHLRALLGGLRRSFDCIVIDTASHFGDIGLDAIELADRVLLVSDLSATSVKDAKLVRSIMDGLRVDPDHLVLVLNHREASGELEPAHAENFIGIKATVQIPHDAGVGVSARRAVPFVLASPDSPPSARIEELARMLSSGLRPPRPAGAGAPGAPTAAGATNTGG